jgi:hypothetical protein
MGDRAHTISRAPAVLQRDLDDDLPSGMSAADMAKSLRDLAQGITTLDDGPCFIGLDEIARASGCTTATSSSTTPRG